jgi:hypothetical protein
MKALPPAIEDPEGFFVFNGIGYRIFNLIHTLPAQIIRLPGNQAIAWDGPGSQTPPRHVNPALLSQAVATAELVPQVPLSWLSTSDAEVGPQLEHQIVWVLEAPDHVDCIYLSNEPRPVPLLLKPIENDGPSYFWDIVDLEPVTDESFIHAYRGTLRGGVPAEVTLLFRDNTLIGIMIQI